MCKCDGVKCSCTKYVDVNRFDAIPGVTDSSIFGAAFWETGQPRKSYKVTGLQILQYTGLKVNNTPLGYVPTASGNTLNLNEFVEDSSGDQWIIDVNGDAKKLASGTSVTPSALTRVNDTNISLTLGGNPTVALLAATSLTLGWIGTLAVTRGGTGAGTFTAGYLKANGTSAFTTVATIPYADITGAPAVNDATLTLAVGGTGLAISATPTFTANASANKTITISPATGYVIPTTTQITNWNTVGRPAGEIAYGTGTGLASTPNFTISGTAVSLGTSMSNTGAVSLAVGSNITNTGQYSIISGFNSSNSAYYVLLVGSTNNINVSSLALGQGTILVGTNLTITGASGQAAQYNVAFGSGHNFNATTATTNWNALIGSQNTVTDASFNYIIGRQGVSTHAGNFMALDSATASINSTTTNQFVGRFSNGYRLHSTAANQLALFNTGTTQFNQLSGTGTQMIVAGATGILTRQAIPTGTITGGANLGGGLANFDSVSGSNLQFNTFAAADFDLTTNLITIDATLKNNWNTAFGWGNHATAGYVPSTRTLTINGVAFDLSANRSWSVGTVTSVSAGNGMSFTTITSTGAVTMGTPSNVTLASTNSVGANTHTHAFAPGGTTAQYIRGDGSLATFPTGGGGNDVWMVQGGTTQATTITQDIYHNGRLKIGNSTASSYNLAVIGTGYFTSNIDFNNNAGVRGFNTSVVIKNLIKINSSNQTEIGTATEDVILPAYLSTRADSSAIDNFLGTSSLGVLQSYPAHLALNNFASKDRTSTVSINADSSWYKVVQTTTNSRSQYSPISFTGADNDLQPTKEGYYYIHYYIEYTNQGGGSAAYDVSIRMQYNGATIAASTRRQNHTATRAVLSGHIVYYVASGSINQAFTMQVLVGAAANGIVIQEAKHTAMYVGRSSP